MKEILNKFNSKTAERVRKGIWLGIAAFCLLIAFIMLFVPFFRYKLDVTQAKFLPMRACDAFGLLQDQKAIADRIAFLALGMFVVWLGFFVTEIVFFVKCLLGFFFEEKRQIVGLKASLIAGSVLTGLYYIGGVIGSAVVYATGGFTEPASNLAPFVLMLVVDGIFATLIGLLRWLNKDKLSKKEGSAQAKKLGKYKKTALISRIELLAYALVVAVLAICALYTNILTVEFVDENLTDTYITGKELLEKYATLTGSSQNIAFFLFVMRVAVLVLFFLAVVAFISRSGSFYKYAMATVVASALSALLVGLFGQYYQIVQKMNVESLEAILAGYGVIVSLENVEYTVASSSMGYFYVVIVAVAAVVLRRPYARGLAAENSVSVMRAEAEAAEAAAEARSENEEEIAAVANGNGIGGAALGEPTALADPCPTFSELDDKLPAFKADLEERRRSLFEAPTLPKLVQFVVDYARDSRLHLSYTPEDIATFIAGLGTTRLSILQGMSGTGKTSLPKIFAEALLSNCDVIEVESSWRDKNELLGYYNEFSKTYTPKKFTQALYHAKLNPETLTFIVLDEMNLSRIEYYFSDFLSLMENEPDKRELKLLNVGLYRVRNGKKIRYRGLKDGHTMKIPANVWFVGTANRDESTFEISDKVYDRANTMNFNKRAAKILFYNEPIPPRFLPVSELTRLFDEAKKNFRFDLDSYPVIAEVERLLAPYNVSFGNRIARQIESFVSVYCSCFTATEAVMQTAVENILLSKVVCKLELKSVDNKEELAAEFERLGLHKCSEFVLKLNED